MQKIYFLVIAIIIFSISSCVTNTKNVTITKEKSHYDIRLDFTNGVTHEVMGEQYGAELVKVIPDYEEINSKIIRSFISDIRAIYHMKGRELSEQEIFDSLLEKVGMIRPEIYKDYYDELEGISRSFHYDAKNDFKDNFLSRDEYYLINLITDIGGAVFDELIGNENDIINCDNISVFKDSSATNSPVVARVFDFPTKQLKKIHAVTTIKDKNKSICMVGFAGYTGIFSAFNKNGIFSAIYYSHTGKKCIPEGKEKSLLYDLRYALENTSTLNDAADYIKSSKTHYIFNCLISLSDRSEAKVLECDLSAENKSCELRSDNSKLLDGVAWDYKNMIANVNSFLLYGNENNHTTQAMNYTRWNSITAQIGKITGAKPKQGYGLTVDEVKKVAAYYSGSKPGEMSNGDVYNNSTGQIIIFQPKDLSLEIFFCPAEGLPPLVPDFEIIHIPVL
jgi:hypothetical protein